MSFARHVGGWLQVQLYAQCSTDGAVTRESSRRLHVWMEAAVRRPDVTTHNAVHASTSSTSASTWREVSVMLECELGHRNQRGLEVHSSAGCRSDEVEV